MLLSTAGLRTCLPVLPCLRPPPLSVSQHRDNGHFLRGPLPGCLCPTRRHRGQPHTQGTGPAPGRGGTWARAASGCAVTVPLASRQLRPRPVASHPLCSDRRAPQPGLSSPHSTSAPAAGAAAAWHAVALIGHVWSEQPQGGRQGRGGSHGADGTRFPGPRRRPARPAHRTLPPSRWHTKCLESRSLLGGCRGGGHTREVMLSPGSDPPARGPAR